MCFSAESSFAVGGALVPAGVYCVAKAARVDRGSLALAAIPGFFAIQQLAEGFVWLDLERGPVSPGNGWVRLYLFFALAFWPAWIPVSVALFERRRRPWIIAFAAVGVAIGLSLFGPLLLHNDRDLHVSIAHHSVRYDFSEVPVLRVVPEIVMRGIYLATIVLPFLLCGERTLRWLGFVVFCSAILSQVVFHHAFTSVWCFFAAVISMVLAWFFRGFSPGRIAPMPS